MPSIEVYFHCVIDELVPIVRWFAEDCGGHVIATRFPPFRAELVDTARIESALRDLTVGSLMLTWSPPVVPDGGHRQSALLDANPGHLTLEVGRLEAEGLRQSTMTATASPEILARWKTLSRRIKSITKAGATAVNPETGATSRAREYRYTEGAKRLADEGTPMLPLAGGARIRFGLE